MSGAKKGKYDDIINMPHHVSATRPHMPVSDRAAQFAPFAALTGYDKAIEEAEKRFRQDYEQEQEGITRSCQTETP